jgi:hypothetical protein
MKTLRITCQFPDHYNAFPIGRGEMDIFTPEGPRTATLTGQTKQLQHRKWEVELEYDERDGDGYAATSPPPFAAAHG